MKALAFGVAANDIPDLAYLGLGPWGDQWKAANQIFDHTPYIDATIFDTAKIAADGSGRIRSIPLGMPKISSVFYVREDLLSSIGHVVPTVYTDLVGMVADAKAAGLEVITVDGLDAWAWQSCILSRIVGRAAGDPQWVRNAAAGTNSFTDPIFVNALAFMRQMVTDGVIAPASLNRNFDETIEAFKTDKALFMIQGNWIASSGTAIPGTVKLMPFPKIVGLQAFGMGGTVAAVPEAHAADGTHSLQAAFAINSAVNAYNVATYYLGNNNGWDWKGYSTFNLTVYNDLTAP